MKRICRLCNEAVKTQPGQRLICCRCGGDMLKLHEHPDTAGPILEEARRRLAWLEERERSDFYSAARGEYFEQYALARRVRACKQRIRSMEAVLELARRVAEQRRKAVAS